MITDLRSEIFLIEIRMNWIFICIYTRIVSFISMCTYFAFFIWMCIRGLSSFAPQLRHYNTLCSNCNRISNRIAIICEICIQVANRILMLNLGLWFLQWANPIRGLINLSDGMLYLIIQISTVQPSPAAKGSLTPRGFFCLLHEATKLSYWTYAVRSTGNICSISSIVKPQISPFSHHSST